MKTGDRNQLVFTILKKTEERTGNNIKRRYPPTSCIADEHGIAVFSKPPVRRLGNAPGRVKPRAVFEPQEEAAFRVKDIDLSPALTWCIDKSNWY